VLFHHIRQQVARHVDTDVVVETNYGSEFAERNTRLQNRRLQRGGKESLGRHTSSRALDQQKLIAVAARIHTPPQLHKHFFSHKNPQQQQQHCTRIHTQLNTENIRLHPLARSGILVSAPRRGIRGRAEHDEARCDDSTRFLVEREKLSHFRYSHLEDRVTQSTTLTLLGTVTNSHRRTLRGFHR
jgi:hypothetical protein